MNTIDFVFLVIAALVGAVITYWFTIHQLRYERRLVAIEGLLDRMQDLWFAKRDIRRFVDFDVQALFEVLNLYVHPSCFRLAKQSAHDFKLDYMNIIRQSSVNVQQGRS